MANPSATEKRHIPTATILHRRKVTELFTGPVTKAFEWFREHPEHSNAFIFIHGAITNLDKLKADYEGKF